MKIYCKGGCMAEITITLSKKYLKELVRHVFIGNWVLNATKEDRDEEIDNFMDTILSMAKNYNIISEIDNKLGRYFLNQEKENEYLNDIHEYEDEFFWDELIERLAERDVEKKYGEIALYKMDGLEKMNAIGNEEEKYRVEFEENGIDNLILKK
jgi:hypothetical protein